MTLLEDIQTAAVDGSTDLGTLLRKCKLLAARLGSKPLEDWLIWESNGYPDEINVPEYRVWPLILKGHFAGPFGSGLRNAPIPLALLPDKMRMAYERYECRQSIASLETVLGATQTGTIQVSTGDLVLFLGTHIYERQTCIQSWAEFPITNVVELLNTVRNRILDFALAVWREQPTAGEPDADATKAINSERVAQIFNTTVYGGTMQLVGSATQSSVSLTIGPRNFSAVEHVLRENGVEESDLTELKKAVEEETSIIPSKGFGPKVAGWVGKMMQKAAEGTWSVGVSVAGKILTEVLTKYYGV